MEEQLRLFDPKDYQGLDGQWNIELDLTLEEFSKIEKAASKRGMDINDYISEAIHEAAHSYKCPVCDHYRLPGDVHCDGCGEVDL